MPTNICCLATHCVPTIQDVHLTWPFGYEEAVSIMSARFDNTRPETNSNDHFPGVFGQVWTQFNWIFVTLDYCWLNMGSPLNTKDNTSGQIVGGSLLQRKPSSINGKSHSQCFLDIYDTVLIDYLEKSNNQWRVQCSIVGATEGSHSSQTSIFV